MHIGKLTSVVWDTCVYTWKRQRHTREAEKHTYTHISSAWFYRCTRDAC